MLSTINYRVTPRKYLKKRVDLQICNTTTSFVTIRMKEGKKNLNFVYSLENLVFWES